VRHRGARRGSWGSCRRGTGRGSNGPGNGRTRTIPTSKAVETVAITPEATAELVGGYRATFETKFKRPPESLEQLAAKSGKAAVLKVAEKLVYQYVKGPAHFRGWWAGSQSPSWP
jgi:hypothetical protein